MADEESRLSQAFGGLAYPAYRRFATSLLLTSLGAQLFQTAILWQIYELSGSALLLGLTGIARAVPHVLLSLVGGVAADRVNRVRLIQSGQVLNGVLVLVLGAATLTGSVEVWHLYLLTLLNGAFTAVSQPARTAIIPLLLPREKLVNAVALNATITQTSLIAGPALAGVAIGVIGLSSVYLLNGLFYLLAMMAIIAIRIPPKESAERESPWQSLLEGLSFVRGKPVIISLLALDLGQTLFAGYRALLPLIATGLGAGAGGYGLLSAAPGVGSLIGTGFVMSLGDMKYKGLYTVFGVLANCAALVILALTPWFSLALVAAGLLGATNSIQAVPRNSAIIAISPDSLRGRVEAFRSMLAGGGPPFGYALSGGLAAVLGPALALVAGAAACSALVVTIVATRKELRDPYLGSAPRITAVGVTPADQ